MLYEKKQCPNCQSYQVIGWGKRNNRQRFKCKSCGVFFHRTNKSASRSNRFIWFEKWVSGKQTIDNIGKESGYSTRSLKRYFHDYLSTPPIWNVYPSEKVNLIIDGTYYGKEICLVIYRDNTIKFTQLYRLTNGEWYVEMKEDLQNLLSLGVQIESITCDGHPSLLRAIRKVCRDVTLQRCIIHVQRMCRIWLTLRPQTQQGKELRRIVSTLHLIKTPQEGNIWIKQLHAWYEIHEAFVNEKSKNPFTGREWYKHKLLKRCVTVIAKALPNLFHYTINPRIPKSTNGLESFFGHLKDNLRIHRGMTLEHRKNFIKWYLYFRNNESFKSHTTTPIDKKGDS